MEEWHCCCYLRQNRNEPHACCLWDSELTVLEWRWTGAGIWAAFRLRWLLSTTSLHTYNTGSYLYFRKLRIYGIHTYDPEKITPAPYTIPCMSVCNMGSSTGGSPNRSGAFHRDTIITISLLLSGVCSLAPPYNKQSSISAFRRFAVDSNDDKNSIHPRNRLMVFGLGNVGSLIAQWGSSLQAANGCKNVTTFFDDVWGTTRCPKSVPGVQSISFNANQELKEILPSCTHILITIPPCEISSDYDYDINSTLVGGRPRRWKYFCDAVLNHPHFCLQELVPANTWIGFISSTSVYGNHDGEWVTEDSEVKFAPGTKGELYYKAEEEWRSAASECGWRLHIFRASGLYGNTRSAIHTIRKGRHGVSAPNSRPSGNFPTSRIHEEDVSRAIISAMVYNEPATGASCWNLADDDPADREQVMLFGEALLKEANLLQQMIPEESKSLSAAPHRTEREKRRSTDRKRVQNRKIKRILPGGVLMYPTYREGLRSVLDFNMNEWFSE
jgi:hypothetical protein